VELPNEKRIILEFRLPFYPNGFSISLRTNEHFYSLL
jgi:hypothetical protein